MNKTIKIELPPTVNIIETEKYFINLLFHQEALEVHVKSYLHMLYSLLVYENLHIYIENKA
jgi:hypothetical protein